MTTDELVVGLQQLGVGSGASEETIKAVLRPWCQHQQQTEDVLSQIFKPEVYNGPDIGDDLPRIVDRSS